MFPLLSSVRERKQNQVFFPFSRTSGQVSRDFLGLSLLCLWFDHVSIGSVHLDTVQMPTTTHSDRCLETFHCSSVVNGWRANEPCPFERHLSRLTSHSQRLNSGKLLSTGCYGQSLYAVNEENFLFHINFIIFRRQYGWSCQVVTIFAQYKSFAVCTYKISIWRHVEDTNKQCRVVRIRLRHQIKYENIWQKFMHPWEVDR